mmetsp:Transcript_10786/g.32062  ORF Transcript_10786/g.32062 Transcript_10786/m.32062 type:complete len:323 (+) Transcript_10786:437-1405(+)
MHCLGKCEAIEPNVGGWREAQAANQTSAKVRDDVTIQVWHNQDIKLGGILDQLHASIVNDDLLIADARVGSRHFAAAFDEEAVGLLHDVRLVDSSDLLALVVDCVLESKLSNTAGRLACDDLKALNHAGHHLVLQTRVLSLGVLANGHQVDIVVSRLVARDRHARPHVGVQIQLLAQGQIERPETLSNRGRHRALQADAVLLDRLEVLQRYHRVGAGVDRLANNLLVPSDRHAGGVEDLLHGLGDVRANAVAGEERRRERLAAHMRHLCRGTQRRLRGGAKARQQRGASGPKHFSVSGREGQARYRREVAAAQGRSCDRFET